MSIYAITSPTVVTSNPRIYVSLRVPVLVFVNPQPLPPGKTSISNVSLIMLLSGSPGALNGTIMINRNGNTPNPTANGAPEPPSVEACKAIARGAIFLHNSTSPSNTYTNVFVVATAVEPPDPCIAGLEGYRLVIQWQVYNGTVRLTGIPPSTTASTATQPTLHWTGQPAPGSAISIMVQSSSTTSTRPT